MNRFLMLAVVLAFLAFVGGYVAHLPAPTPIPVGTLTVL
jgi:hypothetical protein